MTKFFDKSKIEAPKSETFAKLPRPKYGFVEQYTIVDPKKVMNGGYGLFAGCDKIPVVCEESPVSICGFLGGIEIPRNIIFGFLRTLEKAPAEKIANPKMRTVSIIHLADNQRVVVGPCIDDPKTPILWTVDAKHHDWVLYVTPEKNRAIVDALKIHTR